MTSEVCLMNRLAVVLAADSATTVTQYSDKGKEERYFKGANKIFQLSNHHPVGMMIFDSADILRVPWEIVVKEFRSTLGDKSFNNLKGYADEFFSFLNGNARLFPPAVQRETFLEAARSAALQILFTIKLEDNADENQRRVAADTAVTTRRTELDALGLNPDLSDELVTDTIASWRDDLVSMLDSWKDAFGLTYPDDVGKFAEVGILEVFKKPKDHLGCTGLVFAGFGDHDIFPEMIEYSSVGIVAGTHVASEISHMAIDHITPAWLSAFAQTSMSDTFSLGLSEDVYTSLMQSLTDGLRSFAEQVCPESGGDLAKVADLQDLISKARKSISELVLDQAKRDHALPLRRVLGVLPIDEMAELAETLVNLQSLKEKVTKPSETVGGPIDVAVITRSEGLVWIKRKHFFDAALNPRFLHRQATIYK